MTELYKHNFIKRPSHVKRKQRSNAAVSLPCSMNLLNQHVKCSVSWPPRTGLCVLRAQQAMLLRECSDPASNNNVLDLPKSVQESNMFLCSGGKVVPFAWLSEGNSGGLFELKGVIRKT